MQLTSLSRTLMLGLTLAAALPQTALAGHEQLVAQHRLMRAELIGVLYLPGGAGTAIASVAPPDATAITAKDVCGDLGALACDTATVSP